MRRILSSTCRSSDFFRETMISPPSLGGGGGLAGRLGGIFSITKRHFFQEEFSRRGFVGAPICS
ncbi:hypothetical protein CH376_13155 [Leptospira adleri]|uniref:Uncharacterized protein n=1 Tax=Leptospira adleri TaxID=2023186 RepID=A0ABX4NX69_9LEPT|nr:hypothetical protein CH376_13155 [Leptospira adleri]